jgi:hypothetical protein
MKLKTSKRNVMSLKCKINTENAAPIAWSRYIRNTINQFKFEELVTELEKKGIHQVSMAQFSSLSGKEG